MQEQRFSLSLCEVPSQGTQATHTRWLFPPIAPYPAVGTTNEEQGPAKTCLQQILSAYGSPDLTLRTSDSIVLKIPSCGEGMWLTCHPERHAARRFAGSGFRSGCRRQRRWIQPEYGPAGLQPLLQLARRLQTCAR